MNSLPPSGCGQNEPTFGRLPGRDTRLEFPRSSISRKRLLTRTSRNQTGKFEKLDNLQIGLKHAPGAAFHDSSKISCQKWQQFHDEVSNFIGADVPLDRTKLSDIGDKHLSWAKAPDLSFWERLWLAGSQSDNVAATSCVSEIGVAYMKAVQRTHGLFDPANGMHLLLASGYGGVNVKTPVNRSAGAPKYRPIQDKETNQVTDVWDKSNRSTQPGSAAALTAYMIALMQNKLVSQDGCDMIRTHLADETPETTTSLICEGVQDVSPVTKAHTKLGILGALRCEFAYLESGGLKFAVLAMGILPKKVGTTRFSQLQQGSDLGKAVFTALSAP